MAYGEFTKPPAEAGDARVRHEDVVERDRLAALADYDVLDTSPEEAFDEIVFIAKTVCHVPTALISLVDQHRQWFKARIGFEACQTPIEHSVCAHGLQSADMLIIPDLTADERTRDNPLVTADRGARFYAGAPLVSPSGAMIGMLCVLDNEVRPGGLDPAQRRIMKALARQVVDQLELRKALHTAEREVETHRQQTEILESATKRLQLAEEAGNVGAFEMNMDTRIVRMSHEFCRIYGLDPIDSLHADSLMAQRKLSTGIAIEDQDAVGADGHVTDEFEIIRASDGAERWVELRARILPGENGAPGTLTGIVTDVTEQHAVNEEIAHRLKNTLALVQAVAGHTLRDIPDPGPVQEFNRRIAALSTAHDLLLSRSSSSGRLHELANGVLNRLGIESRVEIRGCDCELGSRAMLNLSMILHELGTNAMKYGSLSVPDGRIVLTTDCSPDDEGDLVLTLGWTERGGPAAAEPEAKGLGTRLIGRGIDPEGSVDMDFSASGLTVTMTAMMKNLAK